MDVCFDCKSLTGVGRYILNRPGCSPLAKKASLVALAVIAVLAVAAFLKYTAVVIIPLTLVSAATVWMLPLFWKGVSKNDQVVLPPSASISVPSAGISIQGAEIQKEEEVFPNYENPILEKMFITERFISTLKSEIEESKFDKFSLFLENLSDAIITAMEKSHLLPLLFSLIQTGIEKKGISDEIIQALVVKMRYCNAFENVEKNVTLFVENEQRFQVNRTLLLMSHPSYFRNAFNYNEDKNKLSFPNLPSSSAQYMIRYLYRGSLYEKHCVSNQEISIQDCLALYDWSQELCFDDLKRLLTDLLIQCSRLCINETKLKEFLGFFPLKDESFSQEPLENSKIQEEKENGEKVFVDSEIRRRLIDHAFTAFFNRRHDISPMGAFRLTNDCFKIKLDDLSLMNGNSVISGYLRKVVTCVSLIGNNLNYNLTDENLQALKLLSISLPREIKEQITAIEIGGTGGNFVTEEIKKSIDTVFMLFPNIKTVYLSSLVESDSTTIFGYKNFLLDMIGWLKGKNTHLLVNLVFGGFEKSLKQDHLFFFHNPNPETGNFVCTDDDLREIFNRIDQIKNISEHTSISIRGKVSQELLDLLEKKTGKKFKEGISYRLLEKNCPHEGNAFSLKLIPEAEKSLG